MANTEEKNGRNMKDSDSVAQKPPQANPPAQTGTPDKKNPNRRFFRRNRNFKKYNQKQNQYQAPGLNLNNKIISVVIPLYNEEESIVELSIALKKVLEGMKSNYEVLFIDDGSSDNSFNKIKEVNRVNSRFKCIKFRRNYGKSAALQEGFKAAKGDIVITMDSDLQDDPDEIPALIEKLNEGYDLVSGWKKVRHDPFIKKQTSRIFNMVTSMMVGLKLHDYNCGLKAYVKDVVKNVKVYGEMHRYIPALAHLSGFKVTEIPVAHHERKYGKTKFGMSRFINGFFDLSTVLFTSKYIKRPLHFFGFLGLSSFFAGFGVLLYLTIMKFAESIPISGRPLFFIAILFTIVGAQFFSLGLIAEMITKNSSENDNIIIDKTLI
jgi:glycosyltransferase involved in cell wall biosynthesis